ncbi:MAG: glycosyl transferase family 1, partial [Nanohaloarchaea archaeon QH_8_44_6]
MDRKILMLGWGHPPNIEGGLDIHVAHLYEELQKKGVEIDLALPEEKVPEKTDIIPIETENGDMKVRARSMSQEVVELAESYDIIHTHDWFGAEPGYKARKYSDTKWVSTIHSLCSERNRNPSQRIKNLEGVIANQSDQMIAVSNSLAEKVRKNYGRTPKVIHNGFSTPNYRGEDVKEKLGIENNMIFYVGRHA